VNFQLCNTALEIPKENFIYELKIDGERILAIKDKGKVDLWNRNRKTNELQFNKNEQYPEIVEELEEQEHDFIIDGEIACAKLEDGINIFNRRALQTNPFKIKMLVERIPIKFYAFDILSVDGKMITDLNLIERKNALNSFLMDTKHIEIVPYWFNFNELWKIVKLRNLEGVIAKRKDSTYDFERSNNWLKIKNIDTIVVNCLGYKQDSKRSKFGSMITDRCNVSLLTQENKDYYLNNKPKKARLRYYGVYPSGKLRNPVFLEWVNGKGE